MAGSALNCQRCQQPHNRKGTWAKYCEPCAKEVKQIAAKKWQEANLVYYKAYRIGQQRKVMLKLRYGITPEDYAVMFEAQAGVCQLCKSPEIGVDPRTKKARNLAVDHCHKTGKVRGLLCMACNKGIGQLKDDPHLLRLAAKYLEEAVT